MRVRTTDPCRTLSLSFYHPAITFVYEKPRRLVNFVVVSLTNGLDDAQHLYCKRLEVKE